MRVLLTTAGLGALRDLDDALLLQILSLLDAQALTLCSAASRALYCFCMHDELWRALTLQVSFSVACLLLPACSCPLHAWPEGGHFSLLIATIKSCIYISVFEWLGTFLADHVMHNRQHETTGLGVPLRRHHDAGDGGHFPLQRQLARDIHHKQGTSIV